MVPPPSFWLLVTFQCRSTRWPGISNIVSVARPAPPATRVPLCPPCAQRRAYCGSLPPSLPQTPALLSSSPGAPVAILCQLSLVSHFLSEVGVPGVFVK